MSDQERIDIPGDNKDSFPSGEVWARARSEKNWLVYRLVSRHGKKPQKIPQTAQGANTGAKSAASFTFDEAREIAGNLGPGFGVGYLPRSDSAMVCIDFDGVLDGGEVIQADLPAFSSYAEVSPSKTGLHVLVARPTDVAPQTFDDGNDWVGYLGSDSKFFTVSFDRRGDQDEILHDDELVAWALSRHHENSVHGTKPQVASENQDVALERQQPANQGSHWFHRLPIDLRVKCAKEMLEHLPTVYAKGYDTWLKVGMAFKTADEDHRLFRVWDNKSSRWR
jgi:hypothetical protein